eukprot:826849-Pyramimonas_sp.AAC.1
MLFERTWFGERCLGRTRGGRLGRHVWGGDRSEIAAQERRHAPRQFLAFHCPVPKQTKDMAEPILREAERENGRILLPGRLSSRNRRARLQEVLRS